MVRQVVNTHASAHFGCLPCESRRARFASRLRSREVPHARANGGSTSASARTDTERTNCVACHGRSLVAVSDPARGTTLQCRPQVRALERQPNTARAALWTPRAQASTRSYLPMSADECLGIGGRHNSPRATVCRHSSTSIWLKGHFSRKWFTSTCVAFWARLPKASP